MGDDGRKATEVTMNLDRDDLAARVLVALAPLREGTPAALAREAFTLAAAFDREAHDNASLQSLADAEWRDAPKCAAPSPAASPAPVSGWMPMLRVEKTECPACGARFDSIKHPAPAVDRTLLLTAMEVAHREWVENSSDKRRLPEVYTDAAIAFLAAATADAASSPAGSPRGGGAK